MLPYLRILRPYQWVKNILVFGGVFFSTSFFSHTIFYCAAAFVLFCLVSSGVYILNDICDRRQDKLHPLKRLRPIASNQISVLKAVILCAGLIIVSLVLAYFLERNFAKLILFYLILNIAYSFGLKNIVILDAMIVAMGFLIRAVAGCVVIHVLVTPWFFICTLIIALFLSFGKRRNELYLLSEHAENHRNSLQFYSPAFLDTILTICAASAIVTYSLYTMANETVSHFGNQRLIMTTPFVIFGIFRYLYLIHTRNEGGDPIKLMISDWPTIINGMLWVLAVGYVIYGTKIIPIIKLHY